MPPSIVLQETQPMDISDDEDDYMSSDVDNSDPQMVPSTTTTSSSSVSGHKVVRRTKAEAIKELELQIETAHNYNINPTNVNRSASSYDVITMEDTEIKKALNEKDESNRLKNIVFQRDDGSHFTVVPKSYLHDLLHNPSYLNSTLYKCYNVTDVQLRYSQDNILTRWNGELKFINARNGIFPQTGGYFLKNDLIDALRSGHRFFIYHVHDDIKIGPMISADLISWTSRPSRHQISEYQGNPMEPFDPLLHWTTNSNELGGRDEDMVLEGAIHCGHPLEPMITLTNVAIKGIGNQAGIDPGNILQYNRRSSTSKGSTQGTSKESKQGGRKKKRKTRRHKTRRKRRTKTKRRKKRRTRRKQRGGNIKYFSSIPDLKNKFNQDDVIIDGDAPREFKLVENGVKEIIPSVESTKRFTWVYMVQDGYSDIEFHQIKDDGTWGTITETKKFNIEQLKNMTIDGGKGYKYKYKKPYITEGSDNEGSYISFGGRKHNQKRRKRKTRKKKKNHKKNRM